MIVPRRDKWRRRWQSACMPPVLEFRKCRWQFYTLRSCLVFCSQLTTCISMEKCRRWTAGTVAATISNTPMPRWLVISFAIAWCTWHARLGKGDRIGMHHNFTGVNRYAKNCHNNEEKTCWHEVELYFLRWYMVQTVHRSNSISNEIAYKNDPKQRLWFSVLCSQKSVMLPTENTLNSVLIIDGRTGKDERCRK